MTTQRIFALLVVTFALLGGCAMDRGVSGAADELTRIVRAGSNPYASHWKGKVSGIAMPPNAVVLNEAQTRELVGWILALKPQK